jgi:uncharacterized membrane protein YdjX (TVP38/TMEM64 family)
MLIRGPDGIHLPLGALPVVVVAAAAAVAGPLALGIEPIVGAILASLVFFGVLRLLGRFPDEARVMLRGRFPSVFGE